VCRSVFHVYPMLLQRVQTQQQLYLDTRMAIIQERLEEFIMQEEEIFTINSYYLDTAHKIKVNEQHTQRRAGGCGWASAN